MKKITLTALLSFAILAFGQSPTATLNGKVTDQTGAVIPQASVTVTGPGGKQTTATTDQVGGFQIPSLTPGSYNVAASAKGFANYSQTGITLAPGKTQTLNVTLPIEVQEEKVNVQGDENRPQLDVGSESNANALIIKGKDLQALSDDPDELQSELQALAGPSAGPNGGQIYIDGFTGGQLPPKSAIREIRINQNPFSAEYDKLGYGRIEIFTKPGSDKFHGQFFFDDNNSVLNSRNPFVFTPKPSYNTDMFDGNLGGPINKKASFFIDASRRNIDEFSAIFATDPDLGTNPFTESVPNPRTRTSISPRVDIQLSQNNTLTMRYQLTHDSDQNSGLNTYSLPTLAYNLNETEHTLQLSDTQVINANMVNETRFQWQRESSHQLPQSGAPEIQVQQAFTSGGNSQGDVRNTQDNYELQNYTSITHGKHLIKFGARLRGLSIANTSVPNFNGTAIFSNVLDTNTSAIVPALQVYQNFKQSGCSSSTGPTACPSQISIATGQPQISLNVVDAGLYAEDEWRIHPNLSLTYGLRFESQNDIHDHADFAPRLGLAWGIGSKDKTPPKTVLRAGSGLFYDRFGWNLIEQAERLNGGPGSQQSITITNPNFFPTSFTFAGVQSQAGTNGVSVQQSVYQVSPNLRAPYTLQSAVSIEQQVTKAATISVTYLNSIGNHQFYIRNANAPFTVGGSRPNASEGNIYQYDSGGVFRENQLIANARFALGRKISIFGFYTLSYANSNVSGGGGGGYFSSGNMSSASFLSNSYDPMADYGRAAFDVRHRVFMIGNFTLPYSLSVSPFVIISSGSPFNITTGQDNNGDSIFNDRPILVSGADCPTVSISNTQFCTPLGTFNTGINGTTPVSSLVPVNYRTGPGNTVLNLRLSKSFAFGPEIKGAGGPGGGRGGPRGGGLGGRGLSGGGGGPSVFFGGGGPSNRRYSLTLSVFARNVLNSQNPGPPVGALSSPLFGQTISIAGGAFSSASANRRIDLQARFSF